MLNNFQKIKVYSGRSIDLFTSANENELIQYFKNTQYENIGIINSAISSHLMGLLRSINVENNFIEKINMIEHRIYSLKMLPFKVLLHNFPSKEMVKRIGITNQPFNHPILQFISNNQGENLHFNEDNLLNMEWINHYDLEKIKSISLKANYFLRGYCSAYKISIHTLCLYFGYKEEGRLILGGHLIPKNINFKIENSLKISIPLEYQSIAYSYTIGKIFNVLP